MRERLRFQSIVFLVMLLVMGAVPVYRTDASAGKSDIVQAKCAGVLLLQGVRRDGASLNSPGSYRLITAIRDHGQAHKGKTRLFTTVQTPPVVSAMGTWAHTAPYPSDPLSSPIGGQAPIRAP